MTMNVNELSDIIEIQNLGYRFADCANQKDYAGFADLWAEEGQWVIGPPIGVRFDSRAAIAQAISHMLALWDFFVQLPHAPVIEVQGDRARARWTMNEVARTADGATGNYNLSVYEDTLVRRDGKWLFLVREYKTMYQDESPLVGKKYDIARIADVCNPKT
jgi:ketosteroid isomerase-like protein